jgi:hypothetical protein
MQFLTYNRNPFTVEALQITEENMEHIAPMIGDIRKKGNDRYIAINRRLVPHVTRAYVGWWVTKVDNNLRCYSPKAFSEQFTEAPMTTEQLIERANLEHAEYARLEEQHWPTPTE